MYKKFYSSLFLLSLVVSSVHPKPEQEAEAKNTLIKIEKALKKIDYPTSKELQQIFPLLIELGENIAEYRSLSKYKNLINEINQITIAIGNMLSAFQAQAIGDPIEEAKLLKGAQSRLSSDDIKNASKEMQNIAKELTRLINVMQ